jgi:WD40 repeat protein
VWDTKTGEELVVLKELTSSVWQPNFNAPFNADGTRIAVGASGGDMAQGNAFFPEVKIYDAQSGEEALALKGHVTRLSCVAYSADGKLVASGSMGRSHSTKFNRRGIAPVPAGGIGIWDAQAGKLLRTLEGHTDGTYCIALSPDGARLASGGEDEASSNWELRIWNVQTGEQLFVRKCGINSLAFSPDGQHLAAGDDRTIKILDAQTGQELLALKGHSASITGLAYSPDGKRLATTAEDKTVKVWNAQNGDELLTLEGHGWFVNGVAFSPDSNLLACGGPDGTIRIYNATPLPEKP